MTTPLPDGRIDDYLWDAANPPASDVQTVEAFLKPLRFDPDAQPLAWPASPAGRRKSRRWWYGLAAAAGLLLVAGWSLAEWRWSWPAGRAWTVVRTAPAAPSELAVGSALDLPPADHARVSIARIGTMHVQGDSRVTLQSTQGTRHRLRLERGTVRVRVWAPPGSVVFRTPAGEVIDVGCQFDLTVEGTLSVVRVRSGWVQLANGVDEILVPAGASSEMRPDRAPGVPVFDDAPVEFHAAVRALEGDAAGDEIAAVTAIIQRARPPDVLTLLMLVERRAAGSDRLAERAAELWPPPDGVTAGGVVRGDRDGLWRWRDTLPLPPPKGWLRNWRDALPDWLTGGAR
jgi:hypothetical protein